MPRDTPYGAYNFIVEFDGNDPADSALGGFSDVSGIGTEITLMEYRQGNDKENHVRKIPNINSTEDVTLKRGIIGDLRLFDWIKATREGTYSPRTVTVTLLDEARTPVCSWTLRQAQPSKWVGPSLSAKGSDVAMEELHLVAERIDFASL